MEKGAARRFTAGYVKDPYIIVWRMWFDMRYVKTISRNFFAPPPSVDSAVITIKRKSKPIVPLNDLPTFWGLVQYVMQAPQLPIDIALRNVFTVPQIKHLKRNLRMKNVLPVGALTEQHWAIILKRWRNTFRAIAGLRENDRNDDILKFRKHGTGEIFPMFFYVYRF